jgi:hypothetical protein
MGRKIFQLFKKNALNLINYQILRFSLNKFKKEIIIYDIDNTLADTASMLKSSGRLNNLLFSKLTVFPNMRKKIMNEYGAGDKILFFTVRPLLSWRTTFKWLEENFFYTKWHELFIFSTPAHKVEFICYLFNKGYQISFIDDMSYNHENGEVLFFEKEISKLKNIGIEYNSYAEIIKINQAITK